MVKKPLYTVTITAKLSRELADKFFEVVNSRYDGNISATMRQAVRLIIKAHENNDLKQLFP